MFVCVEVVLHSQLAHWWSPGGEQLAFLTIDDSLVPTMPLAQLTGEAYPWGAHYRYPMVGEQSVGTLLSPLSPSSLISESVCVPLQAGEVNPAVCLTVVNLSGAAHTLELQPPEQLLNRYHTYAHVYTNIYTILGQMRAHTHTGRTH